MNIRSFKLVVVLAAVAFGSTNAQGLNDGLVVYTPFDADGRDAGPNQYNARLVGATISLESAVDSGAVFFDGKDNYVEFPENKVYFTGNYSISIWCKMLSADLWSRILDFNQDKPQSGNAVTWLVGRSPKTLNNMWFDQWVMYDGKAVESIVDIMQQNPANAYLNYDIVVGEWAH